MKLKLLVVEDNNAARIAALEFFGSQGIEVEFALNAERAKFLIENNGHEYHAVITDNYMPYEDGDRESSFGCFIARRAHRYGLPCVIFTSAGWHGKKKLAKVLDYEGVEFGVGPDKESVEGWAYAFSALKKICPLDDMEEIFKSRKNYYEKTGKQWRRQ